MEFHGGKYIHSKELQCGENILHTHTHKKVTTFTVGHDFTQQFMREIPQ